MIYLDQVETRSLIRIFETQGIRKQEATMIAAMLVRWELNYGIHWVVNRLKSMKASLLTRDFSGIKRHSDGSFWGPLRCVYRLSESGRRGRIRADRILRIYGRWEATSPTRNDYAEFAQSVEYPDYERDPSLSIMVSRFDKSIALSVQDTCDFNLCLPISETKVVPFSKRSERDTLPIEHLELLLKHCPNLFLKHREMFEVVFKWNEADLRSYGDHFHFGQVGNQEDVVGKVVCLTKDRGLKKRFIANPHRFIQLALSRLQNAAASYLKRLPESLVYDQSLAVPWVQSQLQLGRKIWSLDLKAATDSFPLDLQEDCVRTLFPDLKKDIDLWVDVSRATFMSSLGSREIEYGKGQPMGLAPSFAIFTVTHIMLVRSLGGNVENFRVIGDDIVISDSKLASDYLEVMDRLGVQISKTKSLMAADLAEFAGRIIDIHGLWPSYKASKLDFVHDPFGMVRQYGLSGLGLLPKGIANLVGPLCQLPLIGPAHCWDYRILDLIDPVLLLELYESVETPYPVEVSGQFISSLDRVPTRLEEAHLDYFQGGFLGSIGSKNEPNLAEHVNSNLKSKNLSLLIRMLEEHLQRGLSFNPLENGIAVEKPLRYLRQVFRRLKLVTTENKSN